jgi:RNA polymerase sigma-70 factor (ECF subfamily)
MTGENSNVRLHVVDTADETERQDPWEDVYRRHAVGIYQFIFSRCGNRPDAEDMTAQVFLRALPNLRAQASTPEVWAYLIAASRTALADFWRDHYGLVSTEVIGDLAEAPDAPQVDRSDEVAELLGRLPERQRRLLELRFLRGLTLRETAKELEMSVANVKVTQWRALRRAAGLASDSHGERQ